MEAMEAEEGPFLANDAKVSSLHGICLVFLLICCLPNFCKYIIKACYVY
jgi:hypothetical protein